MRIASVLLVLVMAGLTSGQQPRFTDVSHSSGIRVAENTGVGGTNPHGVAIEDFNRDGLADIIIVTFGEPHVYLWKNLGNLRFQDVTEKSGLQNFRGEGTGAAVADFNRDGNLDVYLTSLRNGASRLYAGNGDGTFTDVSDVSGALVKTAARSCAWSDIDQDGWPDLYVTCPDGPNSLFRNLGNGTFVNIAPGAGVQLSDRHSLGCAFGDVDADGDDDLCVTNYESQQSSLLLNMGQNTFRDVTESSGLGRRASAVGCILADVFHRNQLDLFITTDSWLSGANYTDAQLREMQHTVEPNELYVNGGGARFTPLGDSALHWQTLSHDVTIEDLDHDGRVDIYVAVDAESGNQWATNKGGNPLWTRSANGHWQEVGQAWGVACEANCVCAPAADFDQDGDLDLLLVNFYSQPVLYRNETNDQRWLRVRVLGETSSLEGIGAKVRLYSEGSTDPLGYRVIQSGNGYARCAPLEAHFGLGPSMTSSYRLEVWFPVSRKTVTRDNVKPGELVTIREQ